MPKTGVISVAIFEPGPQKSPGEFDAPPQKIAPKIGGDFLCRRTKNLQAFLQLRAQNWLPNHRGSKIFQALPIGSSKFAFKVRAIFQPM